MTTTQRMKAITQDHFMTGEPYLMRGLGFRAPSARVPGTNFAGVVEELGPGVTEFELGDEVYGATRGTFAEYVVAPVTKTAPKPHRLSFEEAAVLPYAAFVAMQGLHDHGEVQPGQRVLVGSASGAVGTVAVQLAVAAGATVTGVCSCRHDDLVGSHQHARELLKLNELVEAGKIAPVMGRHFPLADTAAAFESGSGDGRVVITP